MANISVDRDKLISNVVPQDVMRKMQKNVLEDLKNTLYLCYGPAASNTGILMPTGEDGLASQKPITKYTKDGKNILKNITYTGMLENAISGQIESITEKVEKEVGDGTTSATILSYFLFCALEKVEKEYKQKPAELMRNFKRAVNRIKKEIRTLGRDTTIEDIYDIALISTNGNKDIANDISNIYKHFGLNVWINVALSNTSESIIKSYDGLTLEVGYSDSVYSNNKEQTCKIRNPKIYQFYDPIDTPEMVSFLQQIIYKNIIEPLSNKETETPTVILAPKISRDADSIIKSLVETLYQYNRAGMIERKPRICIITNIGPYSAEYHDIAKLCGCKEIKKYLDPKIQKEDIEAGRAPSLDTILGWCGTAELVESDAYKTSFVNPDDMFVKDEDGTILVDESKEMVKSETYKGLINFLTAELESAMATGEDANTTGDLRRRLNYLNCALVDYYIGGISIEDRNAIKDSVDDAVKNCRSAAKYGVGPAANISGLVASDKYINDTDLDKIESSIAKAIKDAYMDLVSVLYSSVETDNDLVLKNIKESIREKCAYNLNTIKLDEKVLCSIKTDESILEVVSEIIVFMFTCNQYLLPTAHGNKYIRDTFGVQ